MRHVGGGRLVHKPALVAWRDRVRSVVAERTTGRFGDAWVPVDYAVRVDMDFYLPRPKRPKREGVPVKDGDKLERAILDALAPKEARRTAPDALLADDVLVVSGHWLKEYAQGLQEPGVWIRVRELD